MEQNVLSAQNHIREAVKNYNNVVLLSSMQKSSSVLMYLFYSMGLNNEILFIDTGYHFKETLKIRDEFITRYNLNIVTIHPEQTVKQQEDNDGKLYLSKEGQERCCFMRKQKPFRDYVAKKNCELVMSGLYREEGAARANTPLLIRDRLYPIYDWTKNQINQYIYDNNVPIHSLHFKNYPSIGCECCTTPITLGEDERAGRWRHLNTSYCGLNPIDTK